MTDVTIIVLGYNEEEAIAQVLETLTSTYPNFEILFINDGSTDRTREIAGQFPVKLISHKQNRGYGAAWKTGLKYASADIVVFYDGDGQFDAGDIGIMVNRFNENNADMVVGERSADSHAPAARKPGKFLIKLLVSFLVNKPIKDPNCGLRVVNRKILSNYAHLLPNGFSASTTSLMLFLKRGYRVIFEPIVVFKRQGTSSVRQFRDGFGTLNLMIRLMALFNPLRIFVPISIFFTVVGVFYSLYEAFLNQQGIPVLGAILLIAGVLAFLMGVMSDQIASLRLTQLGDPALDDDIETET